MNRVHMSSSHQYTHPRYYLFYFLLSVWLLATLSWPKTVCMQLPSGSSFLAKIQTSLLIFMVKSHISYIYGAN